MISNPQRIRINNRRREQAKWRTHKKWKLLVKEHAHVPGVVCVHCLKSHGTIRKNRKPVYLTINHLSRQLYLNEELYTTWNADLMEICCTICNWQYDEGKKSCPVCHNHYIHVMEPDNMCQSCWDVLHPIEASKRKNDIEVRKIVRRKLRRKLAKDAKEKWIIDHPKVTNRSLKPDQ